MTDSPTSARQRLLELRQRQAQPGHVPAASAGSTTAPLRLTHLQESLWFLAELTGRPEIYNVSRAIRLRGPLDQALLERCLRGIIRRHDSLRMAVIAGDAHPLLTVIDPEIAAPEFALSASPAREADLPEQIEAFADTRFDLARAPLFRAHLFTLGPEDFVLAIVAHHIVFDGWSVGVLAQDLAALYAAGGDASALGPLPLCFGDFVTRHRSEARGPQREADLSYWQAQLRGLEALELPSDHPRPARQTYQGDITRFEISAADTARLRDVAREHSATLFMTLLTAFKVLLARYSGQSDIAVGVAVAGREALDVEGLIGCFINTLVLRTDVRSDAAFPAVVGQVRQTLLDGLAHQDLPFDELVSVLSPARDLSRNPLYQVAFMMEPPTALRLSGIASEAVAVPRRGAQVDLTLTMYDEGTSLVGEFEYATDLFERTTVEQLAVHFRTLLSGLTGNPEHPVGQLRLLSGAERTQLIESWNASARPYPYHRPVHELFREQARATPQAISLISEGLELTYEELDKRSEQLAVRLRASGIGPDVLVAVLMHRSVETMVSLLAVLKAGGAYVPMDPDYPDDRLCFMVTDSRVRVVLTHPDLVTRVTGWPVPNSLTAVGVPPGGLWQDHASIDTALVPHVTAPEHPAYLIYTSGSTGRPKGVLVPHQGLSNHELWTCDELRLGPEDRVLQKTSLIFDAAVPECFAALISGGAIVLAPPGAQREPEVLLKLVREHSVTLTIWVPSELRVLIDEPLFPQCTSLRHVLVGGEALDRSLAQAFHLALPETRLGNFYGPTEATVDSVYYWVGPTLPERPTVPIGRPVPNNELFVLDANLEPVPIGVTGELYLGGIGLAIGYFDRPELTSERFVPHPFRPGARLYRTGDLARLDHQGIAEYIGRIDQQVKIRGFRIELGEVEAALEACDGVQGAAVMAHTTATGSRLLVGYVVGDEDTARIQRILKERLPEYMVPSVLVALPHLPVLPSGKLDRKALPPPVLGTSGDQFIAPRSPLEETLAGIWREVLGVNAVGAHDDFFALGGHSLNVTQVLSRVRKVLGVQLPLRTAFEAPSLAELAEAITAHRAGDAPEPLTPLLRIERTDAHALSYSQRRMWLLQQLEPAGTAYNMGMHQRISGPLRRDCLTEALQRLVQRHEVFRTSFHMGTAEPVAVVGPIEPLRLDELDLSSESQESRHTLAVQAVTEMVSEPFDLAKAPLYRMVLIRLSPQEHILGWVMHHAIGDEWSWNVLRRELEVLYNALARSDEPELAQRDIAFIDYAAWQRKTFDETALSTQLTHWLTTLKGLTALNLPRDGVVSTRSSSRGSFVQADLSDSTLTSLRSFCTRYSVSPYIVALGVAQWLLARYCGQMDVAVGTPVANRTRVEAEGMIGSLVNTLVMRTDLAGVETFADVLARAKDTALSAFTHQDIPYDYLIERLRRQDGKNDEVNVLFNVLNTPNEDLHLAGVTCEYLNVDRGTVQFDLGLTIDFDVEKSSFLSYSSELFTRATAERLLHNYHRLLERVLEAPHTRLSALGLASPGELGDIAGWNATSMPLPEIQTIHPQLVRQARRTPGAIALKQTGEPELSYEDLHTRVNQWARILRRRGIGRGALVGLCVERGTSMVIAQLAVLTAGAAYVPLDPAYPTARLQHMVDDAELALLVTESSLAGLVSWPRDRALMLDLDQMQADSEDHSPLEPNSALDARPDDPAYVIYTSGSTGKPKGVMVQHRAVVNFLETMAREPGLTSHDRLLAVTTLSFDIAVLELLLPLSLGATIVLATGNESVDGSALRAMLEEHDATVMQATPATWRMLIDAGWKGTPQFKALIGGEALPLDLAHLLLARVGQLWNMYGPTETTVWSTCWRVEHPEQGISIGRPVGNTQVYVVGPDGQQCPIGVAGEILIGGDGVTLGYLRRPELTAERFVPDSFGGVPGSRLYRTGDSGRWRHDGLLEHLGRLDFQVKVRGHRIELGEIESALLGHPQVRRALVIVREDRPGDARLVAYLVSDAPAPGGRELREHLRAMLPAYMVPQHFVDLEEIPLLPNGKVNRHALPVPHEATEAAGADDVAPMSAQEQLLGRIWQELLGLSQVRATDNFFDLGGHSLLAMRVITEVERQVGVHLEPRRFIFESLGQIAASFGAPAATLELDPPPATTEPSPGSTRWLDRLAARLKGQP